MGAALLVLGREKAQQFSTVSGELARLDRVVVVQAVGGVAFGILARVAVHGAGWKRSSLE